MDPPPPNFQGSASKGNYNDTSEQLDGDSIDDTTTLSNSEKSGLPQTKFEVLSSELIEELTRDSRSSGKKLADGTQRRNAKAWVELTTKLVQMGQLSEESLVKEGVSTDFKEISDVWCMLITRQELCFARWHGRARDEERDNFCQD